MDWLIIPCNSLITEFIYAPPRFSVWPSVTPHNRVAPITTKIGRWHPEDGKQEEQVDGRGGLVETGGNRLAVLFWLQLLSLSWKAQMNTLGAPKDFSLSFILPNTMFLHMPVYVSSSILHSSFSYFHLLQLDSKRLLISMLSQCKARSPVFHWDLNWASSYWSA